MDEKKRMKELLNEGVKVFDWARWISVGIGVWPLALNSYIFNIAFFYFTIVMIFEYIDLFVHVYDFAAVVDNLSENLALTIVYSYTFSLRFYNKKLALVFKEALMDYKSASAFKNLKEVEVFIIYTNTAKFFAKYIIILIALTDIVWLVQPLLTFFMFDNTISIDNKTTSFILPYHFHVFYEINDNKIYALTYFWQTPHAAINCFGISSLNVFLLILVFHISGRLAILTLRIDEFEFKKINSRNELIGIIVEHIKIMKLGDRVSDIFATPLLIFFVLTNLLLCISVYQILLNFVTGLNSDVFQYIILLITVYLMLFVICMNGELLSLEGNKVSQAFYNCSGYNLPKDCVKNITYCLVRSQKPIAIKAGKFSTFSYGTLTDITKTAMGYLSILRKFLMDQ
ncbi:odorant receptor 67a-like [Microplitis mediator]|uniref:odorant receptor 67a-like n=1 Tax=Microplitis mediator TaxID=375433 RepID=UPI002555CAAA|nr:odorant receptor 67a-like [Microplitis mediator]